MLGLMDWLVLFITLVFPYLLLSITIIILAVSWADKYKKSPGKVGFIAALVTLGPVFWDFIPTHAMHRYYCATQSGFTVYKTLEQWQMENPGGLETLIPITKGNRNKADNLTRVQLNQRFIWEYESIMHPLKIHELNERVVDIQTGEILARYVDFDTSIKNTNIGPNTYRDYKWWLKVDFCPRGETNSKWLVDGDSFITFRKKLTSINGVIQ